MPSKTTCETCIHWRAQRAGARAGDPVGECRATPPVRDFAWPRTKANDNCGKHVGEVAFATAPFPQPAPPVSRTIVTPEALRESANSLRDIAYSPRATPEQAPAEPAPLILDAGTTGDAPPLVGASTGNSGAGNRPRGGASRRQA